ncbi:MAG: LysE family translocator [Chloroflexota bacterium]|nr:LysE family translocator [Chloroflexota bacterium]
MDGAFFLHGLVMGLAVSAPVGPIGVLVIRRSMADGRLAGLVCGLGCATGIALYGSVVGFGLTSIAHLALAYQGALRVVGGLFLGYLGYTIFRTLPATHAVVAARPRRGLLSSYASTFALTLINPIVILYFVAAIASGGLLSAAHVPLAAPLLVLGVFVGSAGWWATLSCIVGTVRARLQMRWLRWANYLSGLVISGFGALILLGLRG